ncbi:HDL156Wp [Eremothecium sinecaudum]|uniref:DNA mismatch repair protein MSH3 n=1 Tax=Eremothecium sinecaudum TaxID=45286 RepID=A0A0X8HSH8_9SACH|nr:HDL156Wp [Eremothecium sinecaudum]AMD20588.1 HDL156Wp [Eremothecium sinecaudum]
MLKQPTISKFFKRSVTNGGKRTPEEEAELVDLLDSDDSLLVKDDKDTGRENTTAAASIDDDSSCGHTVDSLGLNKRRPHSDGLSKYKFSKKQKLEGDEESKKGNFAARLDSILNARFSGSPGPEEEEEEVDEQTSKSTNSKSTKNKLTELDQQFKQLKLQNMDKILAVRVGYKYKFFAEDAVIVSQILQIKLVPGKLTIGETNPNDAKFKKFAYCTIPDMRLEVHLRRLMHHNLKVGIVEQTETFAIRKSAGSSGSIFSREVTNVFTRSTYGINEVFDSTERHILGDSTSVWGLVYEVQSNATKYSMVSVNLNSGEVIIDEFKDEKYTNDALDTRIVYLNPSEVITNKELDPKISQAFMNANPNVRFYQEEPDEDYKTSFKTQHSNIEITGRLFESLMLVRKYLAGFKNEKLLDLPERYQSFNSLTHMTLSANTVKNLDLFENSTDGNIKGSLLWTLDHTRTLFGYRCLKKWISQPLVNIDEINARLDAVQCIANEVDKIFIESLNNLLRDSQDLERILNRIAYGRTSRREVYLFLKQFSRIAGLFKSHQKFIEENVLASDGPIRRNSELLTKIFSELNAYWQSFPIPKLLSMINVDAALEKKDAEKAIVEYFNLNLYDDAEPIISKRRDIDSVIEELHEELKEIRSVLKRPMLNFKDEIDYLVEIRNTQLKTVPSDWVKISCTKMVSRFRTPTITKLVDKLKYHKDLLKNIAEEQYTNFLERIKHQYVELKSAIKHLATYDCILSLAAVSFNVNYVRPIFSDQKQLIKVKNGRNPIIESLDVNYVPNDISLSQDGNKVMIITGPNMGGKSSYIRQVALLVLMAQIGCYVPCEYAEFAIFDQIFTRIGAYDNLLRGESTFKIEMTEMLQILKACTPSSLLLLDEVGRGTGTHDGISLSHSILTYFIQLEADCPLVLFITHYPSLGRVRSKILGNYHMSYIEERRPNENWPSVIFLYKLKKGQAHDSYGLNVAKLANVPPQIINDAHKISEVMKRESELEDSIAVLNTVKKLLQNETPKSTRQNLIQDLMAMLDN